MNRAEALRILGLGENATADDIKAAYKETAQILHPDRFASNKKLQERATEQFKNLQEAYEVLTSGKGSRSTASRKGRTGAAASSGAPAGEYTDADEIAARLAGIAAAKTQLVAQRDVAYDQRRNGAAMAGIGSVVALLCGRRLGILGVVAAAGVTAAVWGVIQVVNAQRSIETLNEHIAELKKEQKRLKRQLEQDD